MQRYLVQYLEQWKATKFEISTQHYHNDVNEMHPYDLEQLPLAFLIQLLISLIRLVSLFYS
jgi:hypothetical protein